MTRKEILDAAAQIVTQDREEQYGFTEDCFAAVGNLWADYLQSCGVAIDFLEPFDVANMMILMKIAELATRTPKAYNWIDIAGYAACGGELQGDRGVPAP